MAHKRTIAAIEAELLEDPKTEYETGYNNGLRQAVTAVMRATTASRTGGSLRLKNCYACRRRAAELIFDGNRFAFLCGECRCQTNWHTDFYECLEDWDEGFIYPEHCIKKGRK